MSKKTTETTPIILCAGEHGRAVVYGRITEDPVPGEPVTLTDARMVLRWDAACGGLFGLAAIGPRADTRVTHAVASTTITVWREVLSVSADAAAAMDAWPPYAG